MPAGRLPLLAATAAVVAADQLTKLLVVRTIPEGDAVPVIDGVLRIAHVRNTGAAFGLLRGLGGLLALLAIVGVVFFVAVLLRRPPFPSAVAAALVLGGALGNLTDRLARGSVVDFVDFRYWPAFNVADSAITIGALLLLWFGFERPPSRDTGDADGADRGG